MVKDPVCGMMVDERTAIGPSRYAGQAFLFCSTTCKTQFDRNPASFVAPADERPHPAPNEPISTSYGSTPEVPRHAHGGSGVGKRKHA